GVEAKGSQEGCQADEAPAAPVPVAGAARITESRDRFIARETTASAATSCQGGTCTPDAQSFHRTHTPPFRVQCNDHAGRKLTRPRAQLGGCGGLFAAPMHRAGPTPDCNYGDAPKRP